MNIAEEIQCRLAGLQPQYFALQDDSHLHAHHSGNHGGGHYSIIVVSKKFIGETRLNRQRMIKTALADLFVQDIHALSIKAMAPDEYFPIPHN